jgi:outer membrane translocation and assembly module TamA
MADADLDVIIRQLAKQQNTTLTAAAKKRRDRYLGLAGKAKDATAKQRFKQLAKDALEQGSAAAKRLQISADNAADSYARAMRKAIDDAAAKDVKPPAPAKQAKTPPAKKPAKKAKR